MNLHQKVVLENLLEKYALDVEVDSELDLEWDLRLTGDDALEFLQDFKEAFAIDMGAFEFQSYFHDEVYFMVFALRRLFGIRTKQKLSIQDLVKAIESKTLM